MVFSRGRPILWQPTRHYPATSHLLGTPPTPSILTLYSSIFNRARKIINGKVGEAGSVASLPSYTLILCFTAAYLHSKLRRVAASSGSNPKARRPGVPTESAAPSASSSQHPG